MTYLGRHVAASQVFVPMGKCRRWLRMGQQQRALHFLLCEQV